MATLDPTITVPGPAMGLKLAVWGPMANGDVGSPFSFADWADRCMQVSGTFGAAGTLLWEGSNDNVNWATLNDLNGNALSVAAAKISQVSEAPLYVRPRVSAGDGTTALTASLLGRRVSQLGGLK